MTTPPGPQDTNTRQAIPSRWAVVTAAAAGSFMLAWAVELWLVVLAIHRPHTTHPTATALIPTTTARRGPPWPLGNAPDDPTGQLSLDGAAERAVSDAPASNDTAKGALVPPRRVTASRRWRLTSIPRRSREHPAYGARRLLLERAAWCARTGVSRTAQHPPARPGWPGAFEKRKVTGSTPVPTTTRPTPAEGTIHPTQRSSKISISPP
jgi:hypothetical protein